METGEFLEACKPARLAFGLHKHSVTHSNNCACKQFLKLLSIFGLDFSTLIIFVPLFKEKLTPTHPFVFCCIFLSMNFEML